MIRFIILILLIAGSVQDLKTRTVSNIISGCIVVLSLIYFISLPYTPIFSTTPRYFYWLHAIVIAGIFSAYRLGAVGGADVKVLVPLIFTLSTIPLFLFLIISTIIHGVIYLQYSKRVPVFVPMTVAYTVLLFT